MVTPKSAPSVVAGPFRFDFERPYLMGVLNVTPDSFSDGGTLTSVDSAVQRANTLVAAGADIIDVGGESTRPYAEPTDLETELSRVLPVIAALARQKLACAISIDTRRAHVAAAALTAGAHIVNDVSALRDPAMAAVCARHGAILIAMHMLKDPRTMQEAPFYTDVVMQVRHALQDAVTTARGAGLAAERIWLDPGLGFGKTLPHNLELMRNLDALASLGHAVVVGPSRKSFLGQLTGQSRPTDRDEATAAACAAAVLYGAHVLRVHNVAAVRDAVTVAAALASVPPSRP